MNKWRRWKLFWMDHWLKIAIVFAAVALIILSVWGMASLESYYRNITLAQLPLQILMVTINAVIFVYLYMVIFRGGFSKLEKKSIKAQNVNVKFSDVIGIDEAKDECWEVVQLIKDHARLQKIGGKILRGILMMGPPGCGKTYLAKAIATEAGLPFLSMAASEFNEIFVGVGASRVRKLFQKAQRMAYGFGGCIVFIDELDAMGQRRTFNQFGSGEGNTTQNQLLVAMDGLGEKSENIIVIGATNAAEDVLDPALLRPGRFDRKVYIKKPNLEGREALFKYYLGKVKHESSVDCKRLARKAIDKSPADIENVVKEAALIATRNRRESVTLKDLSEAIERIELGVKQKLTVNAREREMTAYHETGHLITTYLLHPRDDVFKASIIPRKMSLGVVHPTPVEEWHLKDREAMLAEIKVCVASYVAEKIKFGTTTTGVGGGPGSDFYQAIGYANAMVWKYGMGPSGFVGDYTLAPQLLSEEMKTRLNQDVDKILKECMAEVEALLRKEHALFERFAHELLQKQELDYDEIEAIFMEYGKANPRRSHLTQGGDSPAV
ncbi:MAG: ATP-dependent zinc metalloprotease FtsH [Candidatus Omnitrophica bacterium ADurb.Bin277]|nr:MAG: ATP-dependent zinc metalloprotease FtsH [Candidatus Omnitrophica bacterium ADurb.Bin277]